MPERNHAEIQHGAAGVAFGVRGGDEWVMQIDPAILAEFGMDQATFDRLRNASGTNRVYTREEYRALSDGEIWGGQYRANLTRSLAQRIANGFFPRRQVPSANPVNRSFKTNAEYRQWCHDTLPGSLGFRVPSKG